jgi:hypothetical protein
LKLISEIKIAGIKYPVKLCKNLNVEEDYSGKAIFGRTFIKLDESMSPDMLNATALHEIIEVINSENSLKLKHHQIQSLATQLYQVINDNPEMFQNNG